MSTHTNSSYSPLPSNLHGSTSPNVPCTSDAHDAPPTNPVVVLQPRSATMQPPFPAAGPIGTPSALPQLWLAYGHPPRLPGMGSCHGDQSDSALLDRPLGVVDNHTHPALMDPNHHDSGHSKVLIIGAGCTGLALAHGLNQAAIPHVVYERDHQNAARKRDWNMGLHWAAPTLQSLVPDSLFARIHTAQVDPHTPTKDLEKLRFINGKTGAILGLAEIEKFYRFKRSKIRALLTEGIQVKWGKSISSITYSDDGTTVTAHFADGSQDTGSILVGADGPHSATRGILVGEERARCTQIDYAATMCFNKLPRDKALFLRSDPHHPLFQCAPNPVGTFAWLGLHDAPDPEDPESWVFFHYISFYEPRDHISTKTPREHIQHQKELAKEYADPFKSAFEWLADDNTTAWYGKMQHWDPGDPEHGWDNRGGRVTLAGDAAHPMTFQRGQGLNHAITDSSKLCTAIATIWRHDGAMTMEAKANAMKSYEDEMIKRGGEEVRLGERNTQMLHDWDKVLQSPVLKKGLKQGV